VHKVVKQSLLRFGGYRWAQDFYRRTQEFQLAGRFRRLRETEQCPMPDHVMLEPTQRCNLNCGMCWRGSKKQIEAGAELPIEAYLAFLQANPGVRKVTLIGGEPFAREDTPELIRRLDEIVNVVICTNGTHLGENGWSILSSCRHIQSICISLDGPREIHEAIRGVPGCFEKTAETIRALAPHIPVTVNCVLQDRNLDALGPLVDLCAQLGVRKLKLEMERIYTPERVQSAAAKADIDPADVPDTSRSHTRGYSAAALGEKLRNAVRRADRAGICAVIDPPYLMNNLEACCGDRVRELYPRCMCHNFRTAMIAPDGTLSHCLHIRKNLGSIADVSLASLWNAEPATRFRQQLLDGNLTPLCENCPFMVPE
jgi:radical SAM protein with 4Fe4S-binding SPASM domain